MIATEPVTWFTVMVQEATPDELVVPVQLWTVLPDPSVITTGCPASGVPFEVSTDVRVNDCPDVTLVEPV